MTRTLTPALALLAALALPLSPAMADTVGVPGDGENLIGDIISPVAEPKEDCEALEAQLRRQDDNNSLDPRATRELRDKGC